MSLLAIPAALFVAAFLSVCCDDWHSRLLILALGTLFSYAGLTEPDRLGTLFMGVAFLLVGAFSRAHTLSQSEIADEEPDGKGNGPSSAMPDS